MGSPGSQTPPASAIAISSSISSGRRSQSGWLQLLLRVLAVALVLNLCHAPLTDAKQIANVIDDDMDFMLADEASLQSNSDTAPLVTKDDFNLDSELDLDGEQALEESPSGSWFSQSVHRVRRSLSRLFGGEEQQKEQSRSRRGSIERQKERRRQAKEQRQLETRQRQEIKQRQRQDQQAKRLAHGPFKRYSFDETEGSGAEVDQEQEYLSYRVSFTLNEPYQVDFNDPESDAYLQLQKSLEDDLRSFFDRTYPNLVDELDIRSILVRADPTDDSFKVNVLLKLQIPERITDFRNKFLDQLTNFNRIENLGAFADENFAFEDVQAQTPEGSAAAAEPRVSFDGAKRIPNLNLATDVPVAPPSTPSVFDVQPRVDLTSGTRIFNLNLQPDVSPPEPTTTTTTQRQETGHSCTNNYFMCSNGQYVMCDRICNGVSDCLDGSDESSCPSESSPPYGVVESRASFSGGRPIINLNLHEDSEEAEVSTTSRVFEVSEPETTSTTTTTAQSPVQNRRPSCTGYSFICDNGQHIMCYKTCNNVADCLDGSDERFCEAESEVEDGLGINKSIQETTSPSIGYEGSGSEEFSNCRGDATFTCHQSGRIVCDEVICDGTRDCPDGEDEDNCPTESQVCNDSEFKCDNKCLPLSLRCDNRYDCEDQTDEAGCQSVYQETKPDPEPPQECASNEFRCNNGQCIDERRRCDYKVDCPDGEDESEDCPTACSAMEYQCSDGTRCISVSQTCDGRIDCTGGDDEEHCDGSGDNYDGQCRNNDFQCNSGECIPMRQVCDNIYDCNDNSDELACAQSGEVDRVGIPIARPPSNWIHVEDEGDYIPQNTYHKANAKNPCQPDQFRCTTTNVCIPLHLRCDNSYHCNDLSDEMGCEQYVRPVSTRRPPKVTTLSPWDIPDALNRRTTSTRAPPTTTTGRTTTEAPPRRPAATQPSYPPIETTTTNPITTVGVLNNSSSSSSSSSSSVGGGGICLENTEFACHNRDCIPIESVCDGHLDCDHNEDEDYELCNCSGDMFKCLRGGRCIEKEKVCDGKSHCLDGSDESACPKKRYCPFGTIYCDGSCVDWKIRCDGKRDCRDGSDEIYCRVNTAPQPTTQPLPPLPTLPSYPKPFKPSKSCQPNEWQCDNLECIDSRLYCNDIEDCADGSDEICLSNATNVLTPGDCTADQFFCDASCLNRSVRCNGHIDCSDHSDEMDCSSHSYPGSGSSHLYPVGLPCPQHKCPSGRCYSESERCDRRNHCEDGSDEANCCASNQFRCQNGDCVPEHSVCDGITQCRDGTDELNCGGSHECLPSQFRCNSGQCVSSTARCNGRTDCMDSSDEYNCGYHPVPTSSPTIITTLTTTTVGTTITTPPAPPLRIICPPTAFRCDNGPCISLGLRCNGRIDCPYDSSDETDCGQSVSNEIDPADPGTGRGSNKLNLKTYPDSQIIKERYIREGREVIFRCRDEGPARAKVKWSRPGGRPLPPGFTDRNGRLEIPNIRVEDSGTYVCEAVGYASYIPGQRVTVDLNVERYNTDLLFRPSSACSEYQATCMNGECIDKTGICDGTPDCSDGSDEQSCSHGRKCQPNQFMCANSKCVDRTWRCDGENDCGDNSDEASCDPEPSGAPCRYNEFGCRSGHCIPKSFQCDDVNDCLDGTDEIGCAAPNPIRPPPPLKSLLEGETLDLTCVATGNPTPTIVWRLNWGHVPEKCESKSVGGTGTLHCPDMRPSESGAYSCEIINTRGTHFVTPDTIVTVNPVRHDVCKNGFFNMLARSADECVKCFCFGVAESCNSANLFTYAIQPPILSHQVVSVELSPYREIVINEATGQDLLTLHHGVQFRASNVQFGGRETPYLALPTEYMGNQLKSYGGNLRYEVSYMGHGNPVNGPDVIITGNRYTLTHRVHTSAGQSNKISIPFVPGGWQKPDGRRATREEIMMVLANVDNILIRLGYLDSTAREVELINIVLDSAGTADKGLGSVALVEKCSCPPGYVGDSCESCAPGYTRQPGGSWLGHCVPFTPEPCPAGTYGDPRRGVACRECPCPQSGSNNYASGCQQRPDGDVVCNCHEGYTGRRCESCAAGYQGNPLIGDPCRKIPESSCNMDGTYKILPDGGCQCKDKVVGEHCDSCAANSFHLNSFTYGGCIDCFCSGLNVDCSSSTWSRDQVTSTFEHARVDHGFQLVRGYTGRENVQALRLNQVTTEGLRFSGSADNSGDTLYWSLPAGFLGNKLTAYGGKLSYTLSYSPLPGGIMSRNSAPDVVIRSGEDMTLIHYRKSPVSPSVSNTYAVEIKESAWQRTDGHFAERPHVLMALSDIKAIYIKATYTTSTQEGSLQQVTLDTATATNLGTPRAVEVEQCRCPPGYTGISCETCAPGYRRDPEEGIYLGYCVPCECNGHSNQCHSETGECLDCGHNTEGPSCDRCLPGYVGNPTRGTPYDCQPDSGGYEPPRPDPDAGNQTLGECSVYCQPEGTVGCRGNYCQCKQNVVGDRCDQCRPGTYGLSQQHPEGCKECYCSGLTSQCRSVELYRQQIPVDFISSLPLLTDIQGDVMDTQNLSYDVAQNMYTYSHTSFLPKYWSLQGSVLGNQLLSYGGLLQYSLLVESTTTGKYERGQDVLLIGNGLELIWSRPDGDSDKVENSVRLNEDEQWHRRDSGAARPATREDFMTVLTNLEHILIRATPMVPTVRTSIGNVILETASQTPAGPGAQYASDIEICHCPSGYTGNSCETCAPLHYRDQSGACRQCPCDAANSVSCVLTSGNYVQCQCRPRWKGDQCREIDTSPINEEPPKICDISRGFCCNGFQFDIAPNETISYNDTLQIIKGNRIIGNITKLRSGCRSRESSEPQPGPIPSPDVDEPVHTQIIVSIAKPQITIIPVGGSLTLTCSGHMRWSNAPVFVHWYKQNSRLPVGYEVNGGDLYLHNLQIHDSGVYICKAVNNETSHVFEDTVSITISTHAQRSPATIVSLPQTVTFEEYQPNQIVCEVEGNPTPTITWTQVDGQADAYSTRTQGNRLIFDAPRKSDEGRYRCQAVNELNRDEKYVHVYVQSNAPHPPPAPDRLYITPEEFNGVTGDPIRLTCSSTSDARLRYDWNHDGYPISSSGSRNVIINENYLEVREATVRDSGVYTCLAYDPRTRRNFTVDARVYVENRDQPPITDGASPVIEPLQQQIHIVQGRDHSITCEANGTPYPSIKWTKVHAQLANNVRISGNILTIYGARQENMGLYTCIAENPNGSDQSSTYIDIEPREAPSVKIDMPQQTQTVGGQLALYCTAVGIPEPQVEWVRVDGTPLSPRHKVEAPGYVLINDILVSDAGDYQCLAKNEVGEASGVATVRVLEPPIVQITPSNEAISLTEGDELQLTCVGSGYPSPVVEWSQHTGLRDRNQQGPTGNTAYLRIYRVSQADAGFYTCTGTNEAGSDQATVRVDVRPKRGDIGIGDPDSETNPDPYEPHPYPDPYEPHGAYEGSQLRFPTSLGANVTLTCNISQHLTPHWERVDGTPLPPNAINDQNQLTIYFVQPENLGQYRCNGLNGYGQIESFVVRELVYLPLPEIVFYPPIPRSVEIGSHLYIDCQVKNAREQDVHWATDNNRPLSNTVQIDGTVLQFNSIAPADAGGYRCTASNQYGNTTKTAQVVVSQPTVFKPAPHSQVHQHREGDSIKLSCSATTAYGDVRTNVQFQWYREDGSELPRGAHPNSQVLVLTALRPEDQGRYICNTYDLASRQHLPPTYVDLQVIRINLNRLNGFSPKDTPCMVLYICDFKSSSSSNKLASGKGPSGSPPRPSIVSYACQPSDFKCVSHPHTCVKASMVCDGIYDCTDHSDEFNCIVGGKASGSRTEKGSGNFKRWKKSRKTGQEVRSSLDQKKLRKRHLAYLARRSFAGGSPVEPPPSPYIPTYLPPSTTRTPVREYRLKVDQQSSNLRAGESTEVECSSTENTYTDVVWERADGAPLGPNVRQAGNLLILTDVAPADAGKYVCKCRTDEGELYTTSYELNVEDQPHELKSSKIVHAPVGGDAHLQCGADESRQPTYRWSRQYGQLQAGRSLVENKLSLDGVQANDAGTYICTASYRDGETVDFPSILVVTGAIPQFRQEPRSYMSFPTLPDSSFKFNFELTFRPETGDGLLLFNGQTRGSGDYIALSLKDRYAEFRFDFGGKPLLVRAEEPLALNEWHTVRVHRSRRDGYIQVDEQHPVAFPTLSQTPQLDLIEDLYLGGVPNWELLPADAVTQQTGFVGCISRLTLQGRTVELMREAKFKEGISDCRPCAQRPCSNGGVCLESQSEQAYTCVCQPGWTGRDCSVEGTQCTPGVCGTGRCENTELDMECLCPLNRTGDRCQYIEHLNEQSLNFKRNSYAAYGTPRVTRVNVTLSVRPSSLRDSVILYAAESRLPSGDYLALVLRGGHVELLINTAARLEPVVVRSSEPLPLHRWTRIEVLRRQGESILRVGDAPERKAKAPAAARTLSLKTPLFVGGYDRATVKINRDVNITDGFDGCISRLYESTRSVKLLADITDAANIQNCGELNEISEDADDLPVPPPPSPAETPSGGGSGGELEPYAMAPCASDPCENGGTCSEQDEEAVCSCLVGFSGKHCQEHIQIGFNASFRGNGYLEINRNQFSAEVEQQFTSAVVLFSTTQPNGLLLWWGQKAGEDFVGQDFIALAVVDGYVEYSLRLDGEEAVIRNSDTRVDDGNRHIVIVKRNDNTAILEVDRILHSGETRPTSKKEMKLPGHVFIGGIPDIAQFTGNRYTHNFNGCIVVVEGDAAGQINLGPAAINGVNVNTCPIDDGPLEGTEPPVV
ncbi:basement membrane-specific heparan sulfate proteoglycan core protein isoform X10 [Drosophila ananassae]|uniref:basement membrane-specific heparan sulfate proteoglycan core protein isoform X10 n=1 Tax=Drosophila ananassae TaxID=7217 RepID=UPI0013A5CB17|nr:basement membrane-specific heparan sulfate proteoglycan core protein isoform X10 [Drosophila ananassae]